MYFCPQLMKNFSVPSGLFGIVRRGSDPNGRPSEATGSKIRERSQPTRFRRALGESTLSPVNRTWPRRRAEHAIHHDSDAPF